MDHSFTFSKVFIENLPHYKAYRKHVQELVSRGLTTGNNQSESYLKYTMLNIQRMERLDKTIRLTDDIQSALLLLSGLSYWIVISEAWCGDCAQIIPVMYKIAEGSGGRIDLRIVGRDDNPELMSAFLTQGARAIPKLICIDADILKARYSWGPRPLPAIKIHEQFRQSIGAITKEQFDINLHKWYAQDKSIAIQQELADLIRSK